MFLFLGKHKNKQKIKISKNKQKIKHIRLILKHLLQKQIIYYKYDIIF